MNFLFTLILFTSTVTYVSCCYPTNVCSGQKQQSQTTPWSESHKYTCDNNGNVWIHRYSDFECSVLTEMVLANITDPQVQHVQCNGCTDYLYGRKYDDYAISTCDFDADFEERVYVLGCHQDDGNSEYVECDNEGSTFYYYNNINCNGIPWQTARYPNGCGINATIESSDGTIVKVPMFIELFHCRSIETTTSGPTSTSSTSSTAIHASTTSTTASSTIYAATSTDLPAITTTSSTIDSFNGCYPTNVCRGEKQQSTNHSTPYSESHKYTCDNNGSVWIHRYSDFECSMLTEKVLANITDPQVQYVQCEGCTDYFHGRKYDDYAISTCDFDADFGEALYVLGCNQDDGNSEYIECDSEFATFYSYNNTNCNGIPHQTIIYPLGCGVNATFDVNGTIVEVPVFTESFHCGSIETTTSGPTSTSSTSSTAIHASTISTATDSPAITTTSSTTSSTIDSVNGCYPTNVCRAEKQQSTNHSTPYSESYKYTCDNNGNILFHRYSDLQCSVLNETVLADVNDIEVQTVQCNGCILYAHGRKYEDYAISNCDFDADFSEGLWALDVCKPAENGTSQYIECDSESATFYTYNNLNCDGVVDTTTIYYLGCGANATVESSNNTIIEITPVFTELLYCGLITPKTSSPTSTSSTSSTAIHASTTSLSTSSPATDLPTIATTISSTIDSVNGCYPTNVCRAQKQQTRDTDPYSESYKYTCDNNGNILIHKYSDLECSVLTETVLADINDFEVQIVQCDGCTDYFHGRKYEDYAISTCDFDADFGEGLYVLGCNQDDGNSEYIECDSESATFYSYNNTNCNGIPHQTVIYRVGCGVNATVISNDTIVEVPVFTEYLHCGSIEPTTSATQTSSTMVSSTVIVASSINTGNCYDNVIIIFIISISISAIL